MEISKKPWPILSVCGIKSSIDTNPDFQRPAVWSRSQKQLLIDTILRGYGIPKLYWRKTSSKPEKYDVVDGHLRPRARDRPTILRPLRPDAGGNRLCGRRRDVNRRFWRAKGPAPYQPRARPWLIRHKTSPSPEPKRSGDRQPKGCRVAVNEVNQRAPQPARRRPICRPFRAQYLSLPKPRALPWAGMFRTVGAEELQRDFPHIEF
jgi:hypothetical protein